MNNRLEAKLNKHLVTARKKEGKGAERSQLLKVIMPQISGKRGERLASALAAKDMNTFEKLWGAASRDIVEAARNFDPKGD